MGITMMNEFEVRSYGGEELAVLYGSDLMPVSAGKRLSLISRLTRILHDRPHL